jgi:phosphate transport system ATP-binding protein
MNLEAGALQENAERNGAAASEQRYKVFAEDLDVHYGKLHAIRGATLGMRENSVTALIGPSGCGKSTFLRALNRMHDLTIGARVAGKVRLDGTDIYRAGTDPIDVRRRVAMVFQRPNPFAKSIYANVVFGPSVFGQTSRAKLLETCETALRRAALWDEVKDRLHESALSLSGGQQQRLCIARVLAVNPEVILMDEPASALDPIATSKIEDLIAELQKDFTVVIVTHSLPQAARISEYTAFFDAGKIVEVGQTTQIFTHPHEKRTEDYITGRFG